MIGNISFSQTTNLGQPILFKKNIQLTNHYYKTPSVNNEIEKSNEKERQTSANDKIYRFGKEFSVAIDIFDKAEKTNLENGDVLYQFGVECENAVSINLQFENFELSKGTHLYIVDPLKKKYDGAYTYLNNNPTKMLGTELLFSDKIIIEIVVPKEKIGTSSLKLVTIVHGFSNLNDLAKALNSSGNCQIDVNCPLGIGWENQRNSVAMLINGGGFCTGSLVNNTSGTIIPYLLSAYHCGTSPGAWVFRFRWESPENQVDCGTSTPSVDGPKTMNINGATLCAANSDSDFTLSLLNQAPNPSWGVYYNGWDRTDIPATQLTVIHHPSGDIKKISRDNSTAISSSFNGGVPNSHWQAPSWDFGVTEGGSSGAPLFNQDHRVIGQLHGGNSDCSASANNQNDDFGKFYTSWTGGGTNTTRLSNWLDPGNIGSMYINGVNPAIPNLTVDGGIGNAIIHKSTLCGGNLTPEISLFNSGLNAITSATIEYGFNGLTNLSFNWSGNLSLNQTEKITLPAISLQGGNHSFKAIFKNTTDIDQNKLNDTIKTTFKTIDNGNIIHLDLNIKCYASENRWELLDPSQTILATGGPYTNDAPIPIIDSFCLNMDCYTFKLYDTNNDGIAAYDQCLDGFYKITDSDGTVLNEMKPENSNFGNLHVANFCLNINETNFEDKLIVYPNPTNAKFTIVSSALKISNIELVTLTGQVILSNQPQQETVTIDVSKFAKGMYLLKIENTSGQLIKVVSIN